MSKKTTNQKVKMKIKKGENMPKEKTINQQDINRTVWSVCDTFRGVMDASVYKDYILIMLFLKYISDVWKDHYEKYQKKYKGNKARIQRKLKMERFVLPEGTNFYDLYNKRNDANIGGIINQALEKIETANKKKLEGVFRNIDFHSESNFGQTKDRNRRLKTLLEDFNKPALDMSPSRVSEDLIGNAYIYLVDRFASDSGKKAGEFYTPQKVSELTARLCDPKPGARIFDPACGSGGLLIEAAQLVKDKNYSVCGMEVNGNTWALCRMNMFLHKIDSARIEWCNTLTAPSFVQKDRLTKFSNIVANPPFSLDKWGYEVAENDIYNRFWRGLPPKSKGDYAFISHMVESATEKEGRVSVIVPHGVLFRGGAEGRIREKLIEDNVLDAVIGLPKNLFPTTSIPVAILIFDRSREKGGQKERQKKILFIDASREYQEGKNQNTLLKEHIDKILNTYNTRKSIEKYAHIASLKEVKENDYNLNIPRYVDTFEEEKEINIKAVQKEIETMEAELLTVRKKMKKHLKELNL